MKKLGPNVYWSNPGDPGKSGQDLSLTLRDDRGVIATYGMDVNAPWGPDIWLNWSGRRRGVMIRAITTCLGWAMTWCPVIWAHARIDRPERGRFLEWLGFEALQRGFDSGGRTYRLYRWEAPC